MMLTEEDFKAIAEIISDERTAATTFDEHDRIDGIMVAMASWLATTNPARPFDRDKFINACQ